MATLSDLVDDVYEKLYGLAQVERPWRDTLSGAITISDTELTPATPSGWKRGDYAEFPDGEIVLFTEDGVDPGTTTVVREQRGSAAAAQVDGAVMYRNPRYTRVNIERAVNETIDVDLWPHVWSWHTDTVTYVDSDTTYELDQYVEDVVVVSQYNLEGDGRWHPLPPNRWDVERQVPSAISSTGTLLRLREPWDFDDTVYVTAKRRPASADVANLSAEIAAIVPWAAAGKLLAGQMGPISQDTVRQGRRDRSHATQGYQAMLSEFLRLRSNLHLTLTLEVPEDRRWRGTPRRRRW